MGIYDMTNCKLVPSIISKYFYYTLRHVFKKETIAIVDGYTDTIHDREIIPPYLQPQVVSALP